MPSVLPTAQATSGVGKREKSAVAQDELLGEGVEAMDEGREAISAVGRFSGSCLATESACLASRTV